MTSPIEDLLIHGEAIAVAAVPARTAAAYRAMRAAALRPGRLTEAEQHLILLGISAAVQLGDLPSVRFHAEKARAAGATREQVLAVLLLVGGHGSHSYVMPADALYAELTVGGDFVGASDEEVEEAKVRLERRRGFKTLGWDSFIRLDPELFEAYQEYMASAAELLSPRMVELVIIASDVAVTALINPTAHLRRSLALGIKAEELIEVLNLAMLAAWKGTFAAVGALLEDE